MDFISIVSLIGSLGLFMYGMMVMSEGIQKLASGRMQAILSSVSSNKVSPVLSGFLTTALLQSSSATTVLVVSFVNTGLLKLRQAMGVIFGANIGTTITGWFIVLFGFSSFNVDNYLFIILAIGVPLLFITNERIKHIGETLIGFTVLFLGLYFMRDFIGKMELPDNQHFNDMIAYLSKGGFGITLLLVLLGVVLTITVQSSSAAMALTLALCGTLQLPFEVAAAIILGENIGTTISANLAAIAGNIHSKRAALAHFIFNFLGAIWMLLIFGFATRIIGGMMGLSKAENGLLNGSDNAIRYSVVAFHTVFNLINAAIFIFFTNRLENLVIKILPTRREEDEVFKLGLSGSHLLSTPEVSILEARKEIVNFGGVLLKMHDSTEKLINSVDKKEQRRLIKRIAFFEEVTDKMHAEIHDFLSKLSNKEVTEKTSIQIRGLLGACDELEVIGDIYYSMARQMEKKAQEKIWFDPKQRQSLNDFLKLLSSAYIVMLKNLSTAPQDISLVEANDIEIQVNAMRDKLRRKHLKSIEKKEYSYQSGMVYNSLFTGIEKIGDYIINISENLSEKNIS